MAAGRCTAAARRLLAAEAVTVGCAEEADVEGVVVSAEEADVEGCAEHADVEGLGASAFS